MFVHFRAVVFIGPFEHHSNILPWRESCADVVQIAENTAGGVNVDDLKNKLAQHAGRSLKIGATAREESLRAMKEVILVLQAKKAFEILWKNKL